jgi:hypothetical protein
VGSVGRLIDARQDEIAHLVNDRMCAARRINELRADFFTGK